MRNNRMGFVIAMALLVSGFGGSPLKASNLGGNCCRDLDERINELEAVTLRKGTRQTSVTIYGRVNTALLYWNDGLGDDVYVVDNSQGESRFGIKGSVKTAGYRFGYELRVRVNGAANNDISQLDDDAGEGVALKVAKVYLQGAFGKITLGRSSSPNSGITEIDLSGTKVVATARAGRWNESFFLVQENGVLSASTWGDRYVNRAGHMGHTYRDQLRYDTPKLMGFAASVTWGEDDFWGLALRYAQSFGIFKLAAGIGYREHHLSANGGDPEDCSAVGYTCRYLAGSAALLHTPTGVNVHFATGVQDISNDPNANDGRFWYLKGGVKQNVFGPGATAVYAEYYDSSKEAGAAGALDDINVNYWGFGAVQHFDAAATELYLGYRLYSTDTEGAVGPANSFKDLAMVMGGMRIKF